MYGLSLRTIRNYEVDGRYPKQREIYTKLAVALECEINFLLFKDEEFVLQAQQSYSYKSSMDAEELVAGGELSENDKDVLMRALQNAYWMAKERNKEKYTPKKYQKEK